MDTKARKKWLHGITRTQPGSEEKSLAQLQLTIVLPSSLKKRKQFPNVTQQTMEQFSSQIYSYRNLNLIVKSMQLNFLVLIL